MAKYNYGTGATGALTGAATGAAIGSAVPVIGTAIGAASGGLIGGIASLFGSKKKKAKKPKPVSTLDPDQTKLYKDYVNSLRNKGPFSDLYNYDSQGANQNFDANVSRPAYRNFQENVIPSITGQFRGGNIQNSSYTGEALSRAGRDVQENLDAQRSNMQFMGQENAQIRKQNAINGILNTNTFDYQQPKTSSSSIDEILNKVGPHAGQWLADYLKTSQNSKPINSGSIGSQGVVNTSLYNR